MPDGSRLLMYYLLLPLTLVGFFLYAHILYEINRKRHLSAYDSFFYRMISSQAIYDISHPIMYFVMEIPQDWHALHPFLTGMNGSIVPQLIYAHLNLCLLAQILGVTVMAISRMLVVSPRCSKICQILTALSLPQIIVCHLIAPFAYASYIVVFQDKRTYEYGYNVEKISRVGSIESIAVNSNVICASSIIGALVSAVCYLRVIIFLRTRSIVVCNSDSRSTNIESALLVTSFVLFCALCALAGYFVCILLSVGENWVVFHEIRKHFYIFSFFISLANPWCLMITHGVIRSTILRRCVPSCCKPLLPCAALKLQQLTTVAETKMHSAAAAAAATVEAATAAPSSSRIVAASVAPRTFFVTVA